MLVQFGLGSPGALSLLYFREQARIFGYNMTGSAAHFDGSPGPVFVLEGTRALSPTKCFMTYDDQVELLCVRGMRIENQDRAEDILAWLNYYRLSEYWYPMRRFDYGTRRRFR